MRNLSQEELDERKNLFFQTIKTKNWTQIAVNVVIGLIFVGYFLEV
jgi:hypothetical protein